MATVGLSMIVKNEAGRIERYLASVKPWISHWSILDTGSTDDTISRIHAALDGVPGQLAEKPFVDFGTTRNEALDFARHTPVDYLLLPDADMEVVVEDPAWREQLAAPAYMVEIRDGTLHYRLPMVVRREEEMRYIGVTHEFLSVPSKENFDGIWIKDWADGASHPEKLKRDIKLLTREFLNDPNNSRTVFYLAQSHRDAREPERALEFYQRRVAMGGWIEETYVALLNVARLQQQLKEPFADILKTWRAAMKLVPRRAEAIHGAARLCREAECYHEAYNIAKRGISLPQPDGLFIETWIYQWAMLDEFAIAAYWAGEHGTSLLANEIALRRDIDPVNRTRIMKNADFARAKGGVDV